MKAITQRESVVTYIKSCLIFQIPRFMLISKYRVISPLKSSIRTQLSYLIMISAFLSLMKIWELFFMFFCSKDITCLGVCLFLPIDENVGKTYPYIPETPRHGTNSVVH